MTETTTAGTETNATTAKAVCIRATHLMSHGDLDDFVEVIHPDCINREAKDEPPQCRQPGPAGIYATALWLRDAFAELSFEIHDIVADGDLVVLHNTMSGRHVQPFVDYDHDARVKEVFPPTGKRFATTQTHWFRMCEGKVIEHWANRDDLGTALQLGWVPPSPRYLVKMALARRRARRTLDRN